MYLHNCKIQPYWVGKCVLALCGIAVPNSHSKTVGTNVQWCHANHSLVTTMGNPRGCPAGRMGKAKVMMMIMMNMYMELPKSGLDHVTWVPKLGSHVATATPSIWFIESNVSWLRSIVIIINVNLSSNWCIIILTNLLLFFKLVAMYKRSEERRVGKEC